MYILIFHAGQHCGGAIRLFPNTPSRRPRGSGVTGGTQPLSEIPKALQNRAKTQPIVKTVKLLNLGRQHPKMFGKKAVKY